MKNKTRLCRAMLVALVLLLCTGGVLGAFSVREQRLHQAQQEALGQLEEHAGAYRPEVLVLENTSRERAEELAEHFGAALRTTEDGTFATLSLPQGQSVEQVFYDRGNRDILGELSLDILCEIDEEEEEAEPASLLTPQWPNYPVTDTYYSRQTNLSFVGLGETWNVTRGKFADGTKVKIAIVDSGIDIDHPEFMNANGERIVSSKSYNALTDVSVETGGWSVIDDTNGHGTAVAGVIAAQMNGSGVVGIAPDVELLIIKADNSEGKYWSSDMTFGINYAVQQGAHVVSMSISGTAPNTGNSLQNAVNNDVIVVVSAGNEGNDAKRYPASDPLSIGVGALANNSWSLANFSSYGENSDLVAPGQSVYTTKIGGGYQYISGTSFSCPTVAAAVALYIAQYGVTPYETLKQRLLLSCTDLGAPGEDTYFGHGALNISSFLSIDFLNITFDYRAAELDNTTAFITKGETLDTLPAAAERDGLSLEGWYLDPQLTQKVDPTTYTFNADTTLYARWLGAEFGDFDYYERAVGSLEILAYRGKEAVPQIPEAINGKRVTAIGDSAFKGHSTLQSITLPKDVVIVGDQAFSGCTSLQAVCVNSRILINKIKEAGSLGGLFAYAKTILVPKSLSSATASLTDLYPEREEMTVDGSPYVKLSDHEIVWQQDRVLTPHIACRQDGVIVLRCTGCTLERTQLLPMHNEGDWTVVQEPGCTQTGSKVKQCTLCHHTLQTQSVSALGHAQVKGTPVSPGCETQGYTPQQCSRCGLQSKINLIPAKGHTKGDWVTISEPTKTEEGCKQRACGICEKPLESEALAAYTHLLDFEAEVAALGGKVSKSEFDAIAACLRYYNALSESEKAAAAQEYALLNACITAYNADAVARNSELGNAAQTAADLLSEIYDALEALWYAFKQNRTKGA